MAKFSVAEATAVGETYGSLLKAAATAKGNDKVVAEARVEGFLEALAMTRVAKGNTNWSYWDGRSLKAANAVLRAAKLPERDSMPIPYQQAGKGWTTPKGSGRKSKTSGATSERKSKTSEVTEKPKASRVKLDHYVIDEGQQCLGKTKAGSQCKHWGINGTGYCLQHQGQVPDAETPKAETPKGSRKARTVVVGQKSKTSETQPKAETKTPSGSGDAPAAQSKTGATSDKGSKTLVERRKEQLAAEAARQAELDWLEDQQEVEDFLKSQKQEPKAPETEDEPMVRPTLAKPEPEGELTAKRSEKQAAQGAEDLAALGVSEADVAMNRRIDKLEELVLTLVTSLTK